MRIYKREKIALLALASILVTGCGGGGGSTAPTAPVVPLHATTITMVMSQPWTDSGMAVTAGEHFSVAASGTLNRETGKCNGTCITTPAGMPWSVCATQPPPPYTAPGLPCWSLIGKIGAAGTPFSVGASAKITAPVNGELYLGVNDNFYPDDTGNWAATVNPT